MKTKGFTLVESLVTMTMIAIISLVMFPFYQSSRAQLSLDRSASRLAQEIRLVMERAMSAQNYTLCTHPNYEYGYGVYLQTGVPGSYSIFADCNGNKTFDSGSDKIIEQISFETGIEIDSLSQNNSFVIFEPPEPSVFITAGDDLANIIIQSATYPSKKRTININKVGLINID